MTALDGPRLAAYAREQMRAAGVILARHYQQGPLCYCGRVEPCSAKLHVLRRMRHFHTLLAALDIPTVILPLANGALTGEVVNKSRMSGQRHGHAQTPRATSPHTPPESAQWT